MIMVLILPNIMKENMWDNLENVGTYRLIYGVKKLC